MNTNINKKTSKCSDEKRRVAPVLRQMDIGDTEFFPSTQWVSLLTARQRLNMQESKNYSIKRNEGNTVKVTRIA